MTDMIYQTDKMKTKITESVKTEEPTEKSMPDLIGETGALRCPLCASPLRQERREGSVSLLCDGTRRHCYDVARAGYVHLAPRHSGGGDAKEAVAARSLFLRAGYYRAALEELIRLVDRYVAGGLILDAGCGEGYYTGGVAAAMEQRARLCGFDLSQSAVLSAAKAAKREALSAHYAVASVFDLPVRDHCADAVLNLFAPCAEAEFRRVLKPGGVLIVVGAGSSHLLGLKRAVYDDVYVNEGRADLPCNMRLVDQSTIEREITVQGSEEIAALFSMTPYYWRTPRAAAEKLAALDTLTTEISFDFRVYRDE